MSSAANLEDARARAARVLQSFELQVQAAERQSQAAANNKGGSAGDQQRSSQQVADLLRDNAILKKAVQIQNSRMQEVSEKEAQLASMQQLLTQHQEKIRMLEMSNYSLTLHLRQAESGPMRQHRNPDVF
jgi:3-oxoacyl-[acyl-carrier-protein] synthase III